MGEVHVNGWEYTEIEKVARKMFEITLDIILFGNPIPPKEISNHIGIVATEAFLKGEKDEKLVLPRENLWSLSSEGGSDVEEEWHFLRKKLDKYWHKFIEITNFGGKTKIAIIVRIMQRMPPVYIPANMVKDAAAMGAIIDIEYYDYSEENKK